MLISNIKVKIINKTNSLLKKKGLIIKDLRASEAFTKFYCDFGVNLVPPNTEILSLVFSKDRAMQLHAFLSSYFENVNNYSKVIVLFKASNDSHLKSYIELKKLFKEKPVVFIEEVNFRRQLLEIIEESKEGKIIFFVDDMIFTHRFDYNLLKSINPYKSILSLSRGGDLTFSSVLLKKIELPEFTKRTDSLLEFKWNNIKEYSDWTYPLGVSGYMFATQEIVSIFKTLDFKAPNSLEMAMQQFKPLFIDRLGICSEKCISICVHANLTQTEVTNPTVGNFSIDDLLEHWFEGDQIEYSKFYNIPITTAQVKQYSFCKR